MNYLKSVKLVYVEGNRHIQRTWARKALRRRYRYTLERFADIEYQEKILAGGLLIKCYPSNSKIMRFLSFLFWEIVEWKAIRNFLLYRIGKVKQALKFNYGR